MTVKINWMFRTLIATGFSLCAILTLHAADFTWNGGASGSWNSPANWLVNGQPAESVPGAGDAAKFTSSATITEAMTIGTGVLTLDIASGESLTIDAVISGEGGISRVNAGALHLKKANAFSGGFSSTGTANPTSYIAADAVLSGEVYIYDGAALGGSTASFDADCTWGHGSALHIAGPVTVSTPLVLSGDLKDLGTLFITGGDVTFAESVTGKGRLRVKSDDNLTVTFKKAVALSGYFMPSGNNTTWVLDEAMTGCSDFFTGGSTQTFFLNHEGANFYHFELGSMLHCGAVDALGPKLNGYFQFNNNGYVCLDGNDQTVIKTGMEIRQPAAKWTSYGFISPPDSPASIRYVGSSATDDILTITDFHGTFSGSAGLEWAPFDATHEFIFSQTEQTTVGAFEATRGIIRIRGGASISRLGELSVGANGAFAADSDAGYLFVTNLSVASGGKLKLASDIVLNCKHATVGETALSGRTYTRKDLPDVIDGEGALVVDPYEVNAWVGGDGNWADGGNWSSGRVPSSDETALVQGSHRVVVAAETPAVHGLTLAEGAMLVFSNWNSKVTADTVRIRESATVTCAGPFTNANAKCNVYFACRDFVLEAGGVIDVDKRGWCGGLLVGTGNMSQVANDDGILRGGYGPGRSQIKGNGASHFGRGAYYLYQSGLSAPYDDPFAPVEPGSGGMGLEANFYSAYINNPNNSCGGGAVRIVATGSVVVNGEIRASGADSALNWFIANSPDKGGAGGAGGSVWISCETISGSGSIRADGGNGLNPIAPTGVVADGGNEYAAAAGGGGIAISYDAAKQQAGAVSAMTISAGAGVYPAKEDVPSSSNVTKAMEKLTWSTMEKYHTDAEPGTLCFTDEKLVVDTIGRGLCGRLVNLPSYTHVGDLDWTWGHVRFATTGVAVRVTGDLTLTGASSRLDIGGVWKRPYAKRPFVCAGDQQVSLTVDGDCVVSNGAAFAVYASEVEAPDAPAAAVTVKGDFVVGDGGVVYPTSDYDSPYAPRFTVGSFTLAEHGVVDGVGRGGSGGWSGSKYENVGYPTRVSGCGTGAGTVQGAGAGHGGKGGHWVYQSSVGASGGPACDDAYFPVLPGAGGGTGGYGPAGDGGGAFVLFSTGLVSVAGVVSMDARVSETYSLMYAQWFGAGAGGAISLAGKRVNISPTAVLSARGGDCLTGYDDRSGGTGGGGRIAISVCADRLADYPQGRPRHTDDPTSKILEGCLTWAGRVDVSAGENDLRSTATQPVTDSYGENGSIWFNAFRERLGVMLIVR